MVGLRTGRTAESSCVTRGRWRVGEARVPYWATGRSGRCKRRRTSPRFDVTAGVARSLACNPLLHSTAQWNMPQLNMPWHFSTSPSEERNSARLTILATCTAGTASLRWHSLDTSTVCQSQVNQAFQAGSAYNRAAFRLVEGPISPAYDSRSRLCGLYGLERRTIGRRRGRVRRRRAFG
jgi:hypothetical protein